MRPVDPHTANRFARVSPSLCHCLRLTLADGSELGFTDHDRDIIFTGTVFRAHIGAVPSAMEQTVSLSADNADIVGVLSVEALSAAAIDGGDFDGATVQVWRVDWEDPSARVLMRSGRLGEISRTDNGYRAEFRGQKAALSQIAGRVYGRQCDAHLGDVRCRVDTTAAEFRATATVTQGDSHRLVATTDETYDSGWFSLGTIEVGGKSRAIMSHHGDGLSHTVTLWDALAVAPAPGDEVTLVAGCDKAHATCAAKFTNAINFQGFPHIPGTDVLIRTAVRRGAP